MLRACFSCNGFLPQDFASCPHCDAPAAAPAASPSRIGKLAAQAAAIVAGAAVSMTLMACYGVPPCDSGDDNDNDGYCRSTGEDCNDRNPRIHDYATDIPGDGIDQDCDGADDEAVIDAPDGGDAGVNDCVKCSGIIAFPDVDPAAACPGSAGLHAALVDCACNDYCVGECTGNLCNDDLASADCQSCLSTGCQSAHEACMND